MPYVIPDFMQFDYCFLKNHNIFQHMFNFDDKKTLHFSTSNVQFCIIFSSLIGALQTNSVGLPIDSTDDQDDVRVT